MHSAVETFMKKFISVFIVFISLSGTSIASNDQTGTVDSVNIPKKEVTIKILSGKSVKMGDRLEINTPDGPITLSVKFPMMTLATCSIQGKGKLSSIKSDMPVYPYGKIPRTEEPSDNGSRFSDTGQGMIRDNSTGIFWLQDANYTRKTMSWEDAVTFVEKLDAAGYTDWRLPTKEEFDFFLKAAPEELKKSFDNMKFFYWTSTVYPLEPGLIWTADIDNRNTKHTFRTNDNYIWPVRDGKLSVRSSHTMKKEQHSDHVKAAAERECGKNSSRFVSYSKKLDAMTVSEYEIICKKSGKETKLMLGYDKLFQKWSD